MASRLPRKADCHRFWINIVTQHGTLWISLECVKRGRERMYHGSTLRNAGIVELPPGQAEGQTNLCRSMQIYAAYVNLCNIDAFGVLWRLAVERCLLQTVWILTLPIFALWFACFCLFSHMCLMFFLGGIPHCGYVQRLQAHCRLHFINFISN
jgi:hypothetical protein